MSKSISISTKDNHPIPEQEYDGTSRLSDPYGSLATISKNEGIVLSPISQWDLVQRRAWPPLPYQAYCVKHFLQECLVYYSLENEKLDNETARISEVTPAIKLKKSEKVTPTPTRIQPRRGAKKAPASERDVSKREPKEVREAKAKIQNLRQSLQLHLPWSEFSGCLETELTKVKNMLPYHREKAEAGGKNRSKRRKSVKEELSSLGKSFIHSEILVGSKLDSMKCRYCQLRPQHLSELNEMAPPRIAPVAPMHIISMDEIKEDQVGQFGGVRFAVKPCEAEDKIVLLTMKMVDDLENLQEKPEGGLLHKEITKATYERDNVRHRKKRKSI